MSRCESFKSNHADTGIFNIFPKQALAFEFFDSLSSEDIQKQNIKIYSFESKGSGLRKFAVAAFSRILAEYLDGGRQDATQNHGHFYEIIREDFPCRAYFDLEFSRTDNPTVVGDRLTAKWIYLVCWKVHELWGITLDENNIIVLDSSTSQKYSKHVMLNIPCDTDYAAQNIASENLFESNASVGLLVDHILQDMFPTQRKRKFSEFLVATDSKKTCFIDLGVYSRNRAFRIFGCSKFGKTQAFKLDVSDKSIYHGLKADYHSREDLFRHYLRKTFVVPADIMELADVKSKTGLSSFGCRALLETSPMEFERKSIGGNGQRPPNSDSAERDEYNFTGRSSRQSSSFWSSRVLMSSRYVNQGSPFPRLDEFVRKNASNGDFNGSLRSWTIFRSGLDGCPGAKIKQPEPRSDPVDPTACSILESSDISMPSGEHRAGSSSAYKVRYQIHGNKFCANIGRQHKNNGIMLEVCCNTATLSQLCWDPDCRGFRSCPVPVPLDVVPATSDMEKCIQMNLTDRKG